MHRRVPRAARHRSIGPAHAGPASPNRLDSTPSVQQTAPASARNANACPHSRAATHSPSPPDSAVNETRRSKIDPPIGVAAGFDGFVEKVFHGEEQGAAPRRV